MESTCTSNNHDAYHNYDHCDDTLAAIISKLQKFAWAHQRAKVCFIFHNGTINVLEECFIK